MGERKQDGKECNEIKYNKRFRLTILPWTGSNNLLTKHSVWLPNYTMSRQRRRRFS
jgi:hypothetical protein